MIVEASSPEELARGMQGLAIRMARAINRVFDRSGNLFSGRYHATLISSSWTLRNMLRYVLLKAKKHERFGPLGPLIDPASSGPWFDGWADAPQFVRSPGPPPVATPRCPFLRDYWRMHAPIGLYEYPGRGRAIHILPSAITAP